MSAVQLGLPRLIKLALFQTVTSLSCEHIISHMNALFVRMFLSVSGILSTLCGTTFLVNTCETTYKHTHGHFDVCRPHDWRVTQHMR